MRRDTSLVQSGCDAPRQCTCATEKPEAAFHFEQQLIRRFDTYEWRELPLTPRCKMSETFAFLPCIARHGLEIRREGNGSVERLPDTHARCACCFIAREYDLLTTLGIDDRERSNPLTLPSPPITGERGCVFPLSPLAGRGWG